MMVGLSLLSPRSLNSSGPLDNLGVPLLVRPLFKIRASLMTAMHKFMLAQDQPVLQLHVRMWRKRSQAPHKQAEAERWRAPSGRALFKAGSPMFPLGARLPYF